MALKSTTTQLNIYKSDYFSKTIWEQSSRFVALFIILAIIFNLCFFGLMSFRKHELVQNTNQLERLISETQTKITKTRQDAIAAKDHLQLDQDLERNKRLLTQRLELFRQLEEGEKSEVGSQRALSKYFFDDISTLQIPGAWIDSIIFESSEGNTPDSKIRFSVTAIATNPTALNDWVSKFNSLSSIRNVPIEEFKVETIIGPNQQQGLILTLRTQSDTLYFKQKEQRR